jgi:DNA-binding NarL/FixJ family response regulator
MNRKIVNIIICETSHIIFEGLTRILNNSINTCAIHFANNMNEMQQLNLRYNADIVILNPVLIQNITKDFLSIQKEFTTTHWLGIVYNHIDQPLLSLFEGIIYINESPGEINALIKKMLTIENSLHNQLPQNETLSEREIEVLKLLVNGNANKEIADKLNISINTVITHRKNISQKTGIKSVSGLTIYAVVNTYISVDTM